ncbi:MAG: hypothetical protein GTN74_06875 [Proteobacteria bacterium]|nr:hypothetical protein [Pseudomonadota bacterium]NIS69320.1 hypothetical protein [Pseudomonadota bacterium]
MPRNPSDTPVVYDSANRELRTVRDYFAGRDEEVLNIKWEDGIEEDALISPDQCLAQIIWDGASREPIDAPAECSGVIGWINGRIEYETLDLKSQVLLRLRRE